MNCPRCGGALESGPRDFGSQKGDVSVVITGVPAGRCPACRETFTTDATQARLEDLGEQARQQAIEEGRKDAVRAWTEAPPVAAQALAAELRQLAQDLQAATSGDDPARMAQALGQVSTALAALVERARAAGITLPDLSDHERSRTES